ncbi:MAG: hypothetical protein OHK0053_22680 [Microscillaceae bacterium]
MNCKIDTEKVGPDLPESLCGHFANILQICIPLDLVFYADTLPLHKNFTYRLAPTLGSRDVPLGSKQGLV